MRRVAHRVNRALGRYRQPIWLFGAGRSGTTWLSELLNPDGRLRYVFEPFHPRFCPQLQGAPALHAYLRPGLDGGALDRVAHRVFSGATAHPRAERFGRGLLHDGLLIKDVFANLLSAWAIRRFSLRRAVFLVRSPFATAASKLRTKDWLWLTDPARFLRDTGLVVDHLGPYRDVLARPEDDYILRQIMIWSVLHLVPLRQLRDGEVCIVTYEDLLDQPRVELNRVFRHLWPGDVEPRVARALSILHRPSVTSRRGAVHDHDFSARSWRSKIDSRRYERGMEILDRLGVRTLVDDDGRPLRAAFERRLRSDPG